MRLAILPAAVFMVLTAPYSAKLVHARGARFTLLTGYVFCLFVFLTMLLLYGRKRSRSGRLALPTPSLGSASGLPARLLRAR
jgi:hypothetical protein